MTKIRLFIVGGNVPSGQMLADADQLRKIPIKRLADFLKWVVKQRVLREVYSIERWKEVCKKFGLKSEEELYGAHRFAVDLFERGTEVELSEVVKDLQNLGFENEKVELITDKLESLWAESEDYLVRVREETVPILNSLNWRVDIRYSSSDYLDKPEPIALFRIGVSDGTTRHEIYIELDKDRLSWLDATIGKMKRAFLKAEESISQRGITN